MINEIKEASKLLESLIIYTDTPEHPHEYTRRDTGKLLAGVSSVADLAKSKDSGNWLAQWKVNEALEYINDHVGDFTGSGGECTAFYTQPFEDVLKDAKYAHKVKGKEATDIGTGIHAILEDYVSSQIDGSKIIILDNDITKLFKDDLLKWETDNDVHWLASELLVGDLENDVAGRLDGLAMVNGKLTIIDFKAANSVPPNYYIQLAGYALCLEAMGINAEDRIILRLPKTQKRKVWNEEFKKYNMVDNKIEFIRPPTNYDFDKECFISCRNMYRWLNQSILK